MVEIRCIMYQKSEPTGPRRGKPTQIHPANFVSTDLILDFTLIKKDVIN